jgi:hypothetical protein
MGRQPHTEWRTACLAAALFAITVNFLQPLAHAAFMRDGASSTLWSVFCGAAAADPGGDKSSKPATAENHGCCLGLAHAPPVAPPSASYAVLSPIVATIAPLAAVERPTSVGVRYGPTRPRGPPVLA